MLFRSGPPPASSATSSTAVIANVVGTWCFRAEYTPTGNIYNASKDSTPGECFSVRDSTSIATVQKWLPNDRVTVTSAGSTALNGTLNITLRTGSCTGTIIYTQPQITLTNTSSGTSFDTTNTNVFVNLANTATPYYWRSVFDSTDTKVDGFTRCETTSITINDTP